MVTEIDYKKFFSVREDALRFVPENINLFGKTFQSRDINKIFDTLIKENICRLIVEEDSDGEIKYVSYLIAFGGVIFMLGISHNFTFVSQREDITLKELEGVKNVIEQFYPKKRAHIDENEVIVIYTSDYFGHSIHLRLTDGLLYMTWYLPYK